MSTDYEVAKQAMSDLVLWAAENDAELGRNESDTRLHLIDRLLFECLGWNREDCATEQRFEGKYTDYELGTNERLAIWEAKREGTYFTLPAGFNRRVCKLQTIAEHGAAIESAIKQAIQYCQERSVGIGVVCNGHQLIAFLGSRQDGIRPFDGSCLVFTSLEDMRSTFRDLWQSLSKPGTEARNLHVLLKDAGRQPPPEKLAQRIIDYPGFKNRNPLQLELQILGELFIEDISKTPELEQKFLQECYCTSGALSQYALVSKQILQARYSSLFQKEVQAPVVTPVRTKSNLSKELTSDVLAASLKRRPIILLGDVGVGKTIFVRHLIKVEAPDLLGTDKALVLYIDFGKEPALAKDLEGFIMRRIRAQLREEYEIDIEEDGFVRGVYHGDLLRFQKGIFAPLKETDPKSYLLQEIELLSSKLKDKAQHLQASLIHISKAHKRQIVLFLDNIDQRPIEFQESVFLIGQSFAGTWPMTVFMSLRPDTFSHSKTKGSLAAYHPRVFAVGPPRVDLVLSRRFQFALSELEGTGRLNVFPEGLTLNQQSLSAYISILRYSFENNDALTEFIENLSGGNVRTALEFVSDFVGSGHVDSQKILDIYAESGDYLVPVHEFTRAVLYKDHEYYDPTVSKIANLFDVSSPDGREHFLLANILSFVERYGSTPVDEGYVEVNRVFEFAMGIGFDSVQAHVALNRATSKKLLEANPRFSDTLSVTSVRITTIGAYTIKKLVSMFTYVDAVIIDTPIINAEKRKAIKDVSALLDRLERAELFRSYLDDEWARLNTSDLPFDWRVISSQLQSDISRVRRRQEQIRK